MFFYAIFIKRDNNNSNNFWAWKIIWKELIENTEKWARIGIKVTLSVHCYINISTEKYYKFDMVNCDIYLNNIVQGWLHNMISLLFILTQLWEIAKKEQTIVIINNILINSNRVRSAKKFYFPTTLYNLAPWNDYLSCSHKNLEFGTKSVSKIF